MGHKGALDDLSYESVQETFDYDPETGLLTWKVRLSKRVRIGDVAGFAQKRNKGRLKVGINNKDYMVHRIIWLWMTGAWPEFEVDHRDENPANNRWKNLRHATSSQNQRNRGPQKNNTSGYKGVTYVAKRKRWIAGVKLNGYRHNLGTFMSAEEAYAAYCKAASRLHGAEFLKTK